MLVKFFNRGKGGGAGPVDYLLGKNRDRENARLLSGDPQQIIEIIDSLETSQRYKSGVLSFEEPNIPEDLKEKIMAEFESALLPGLEKNQYSILWVEHTDKERLELNFVIPAVELQSGKRLQPYYSQVDKPRVNAWKDTVNHRFGFSDPNAPEKAQTLINSKDLPRKKSEAKEKIHSSIEGLVLTGVIRDRKTLISELEKSGFNVARQTKNSISLADPEGGQNLRLTGEIYAESFKFSGETGKRIRESQERYRARGGERYEETKKQLAQELQRKLEFHRKRFKPNPPENKADAKLDAVSSHNSERSASADFVGRERPSNQPNRKKPERPNGDLRENFPKPNQRHDFVRTEEEQVKNDSINSLRERIVDSVRGIKDGLQRTAQRITDAINGASRANKSEEIDSAISRARTRTEQQSKPLPAMQALQRNDVYKPRT